MERVRQVSQLSESTNSIIWLIAVSVVIHVLLLVLLNGSVQSVQGSKTESVHIIKARLYFPPAPVKPKEVLPTESSPSVEDLPPPVKIVSEPNSPHDAEVNNLSQTLKRVNTVVEKADDMPKENTAVPSRSTQVEKAYRHLLQKNQTQIQQMAAEAAAQYREHKNSPVILPAATAELTQDEKLLKSIQKRVNCDGVVRKTTAILTGIMGGNIKCTEQSDFQPYIRQQLDKVGADKR